MRARSSIFSFDTLQAIPAPSAGVKWCIGFLLIFRILIGWAAPDPTARYDILNAAEYLRAAKGRDLKVVFFGSSRLQSAVIADEWARRAGLKPGEVANLAVNDGRLWDALYMIETSGGLPASVNLVVVEIAPWEFNRNLLNPGFAVRSAIPQHMRHLATLSERLAVDDVESRMDLLADFVWPLYERQPLNQWQFPVPIPQPALPLPIAMHWDERQRERAATAGALKGSNIAKVHFFHPEISSFAVWNLDRLLARVAGDSRRVVLAELPAREEYLRAIEQEPASRAFYQQVQELVKARTSENVSFLSWELARDCGLSENIFVDYGHLSREGAQTFTGRLFDEIAAKQIVAKPK